MILVPFRYLRGVIRGRRVLKRYSSFKDKKKGEERLPVETR